MISTIGRSVLGGWGRAKRAPSAAAICGVASLHHTHPAAVFCFALMATMFSAPVAWALAPADDAAAADALVIEQEQIADKFARLEETLLRMAELTAATDPRRAALLKKAVAQSKEQLIGVQLEALVELFRNDQLSKAIENQKTVDGDLRALLQLLLSENRAKRLESEKARIRAYLKRLNQIIKQQKGIQGRTAGAGEPKRLAGEQGKLAGDTGKLAQDIQESEEAESGSAEDKDGSTEGKDGPHADEQPDSGEKPGAPSEGKSDQEADGQPGREDESKPKGDGQPQDQDGQPPEKGADGQEGKPSSSQQQRQQQQGDQPQNQNPARKRIEAATQRMRQAREKLEKAHRNEAVEQQEEAIRQLQEAKAQLEEILRQLREEEIEQVLTMLEARFVKMLQMQREVYVGTQRLDKASKDGASKDGASKDGMTHNQEIEAGRLSSREAEIVIEADKALALLREEGSAVAFPEAVSQVSDDMRQLVRRLQEAKIGQITQAIEEDVIAALEEMIEALKQAIEDAEERRGQQGSQDGPSDQSQDPSLVDLLAELRMIRALQMRINTRTERYSKLVTSEQAGNAELIEALRRLADRQERVFQITRDFEKGMNR